MNARRYLAVTGGIGGSKLALGLSKILNADELGFIVNTGDDFEHLGLHISPDIDTLLYTLADLNNTETGWGRRDETWQFMSTLADLGGETWFKLGDKDLALNIRRSSLLNSGASLNEITRRLAESLGVLYSILPMSNDPVRTRVHTEDGPMDFQHYFVREQCKPAVKSFEYPGAATAKLNPEIGVWLESEQLAGIILCPSSPFISIDPILSVPTLRDALRRCAAPVIAISPIVGGRALKGPLAKIMREISAPATACWIAEHYGDFLDGFVIDETDEALASEIEALGMTAMCTNIVMNSLDDRVQSASNCLEFLVIAMLRDVLTAIQEVDQFDGILLVSRSQKIQALAREFVSDVFMESAGSDHSRAVTEGNRYLQDRYRVDSSLVLSGDVPRVTAHDIRQVIEHHEGVSLVPNASGEGTNAVLTSPPNAITCDFGGASLARHIASAEAAGLKARIVRNENIGYDIDDPRDLKQAIIDLRSSYTSKYLESSDIAARLSYRSPNQESAAPQAAGAASQWT
jgi:LPPG:FO 2-phospho-L-lactate transferase